MLKRYPQRRKSFFTDEAYSLYIDLMAQAETMQDADLKELWQDALQTFARTGDMNFLFTACAYVRKPVDIETFIFDRTYLGLDKHLIYPKVLEACHEIDTDSYQEAVLKGAIGTGKTTIANVMLGRQLYKISCMRDPQEFFGVQTKSSLVFTIQSVRFNTAKKAVFEEFGQYIHNSPYFKYIYPYDPNVQSEMIFRKNNVRLMPVSSSSTGVISMNVIGGILDEMNFMAKVEHSKSSEAEADGSFDQARNLYNTLARRRKSRFTKKGKLPGTLFIVSSSRFPDDFTESKAAESTMCGGKDPGIYVYSYAQWEAKSRDTFLNESFRVMVGTESMRSRIMQPGEEPIDGCKVIEVPMDFYSDFDRDIDGSIRDFAGITTLATTPFIVKRDYISRCMNLAEAAGYRNPFNYEEIDLTLGQPIPDALRLRLDVDSPRAVHIDLGLKKDAAGVACGHIAGWKSVERIKEDTGDYIKEIAPVIAYDFILRVVPPPNNEIDFSDIRGLIISMKKKFGIPIKWVTYDGFQSVDSRQILAKQGFSTGYLSVEKIEPYRALRDAIYEERLLLPKHQFAAKELAELEQYIKNNKLKVDHRPNGTKDVADALCGVTSLLLSRTMSWHGIETLSFQGLQLKGDPKRRIGSSEDNGFWDEIDDEGNPVVRRSTVIRRSIKRRSVSRK